MKPAYLFAIFLLLLVAVVGLIMFKGSPGMHEQGNTSRAFDEMQDSARRLQQGYEQGGQAKPDVTSQPSY